MGTRGSASASAARAQRASGTSLARAARASTRGAMGLGPNCGAPARSVLYVAVNVPSPLSQTRLVKSASNAEGTCAEGRVPRRSSALPGRGGGGALCAGNKEAGWRAGWRLPRLLLQTRRDKGVARMGGPGKRVWACGRAARGFAARVGRRASAYSEMRGVKLMKKRDVPFGTCAHGPAGRGAAANAPEEVRATGQMERAPIARPGPCERE